MNEPQSAADRRPNDEPFYVPKTCEDCGEKLVYLYVAEGRSDSEPWYDEFTCPKCRNGVYLDVPEGVMGMSEPHVLSKDELAAIASNINAGVFLNDDDTRNMLATIRQLQSDFDIVDEALTLSERDNEHLTWKSTVLHDALSEIVHGDLDPRQVASDAFSKIAKGASGREWRQVGACHDGV